MGPFWVYYVYIYVCVYIYPHPPGNCHISRTVFGTLEDDDFPFPRWHMLVPWMLYLYICMHLSKETKLISQKTFMVILMIFGVIHSPLAMYDLFM